MANTLEKYANDGTAYMSEEDIANTTNFIRIDCGFIPRLFWNYYCYLDHTKYTIDSVLEKYNIPVRFTATEFRKTGTPYAFCFVRCRKKFGEIMEEEVFPDLHRKNTILYGKEYTKECNELKDALYVVIDQLKEMAQLKEEKEGEA